MYIHNWKSFNEGKETFSNEGNFKKVYLSKSNTNIVIKKFTESDSIIRDYLEKLSNEYPDLFAKIYKIDYVKKVIIQEKLDLVKVKEDLKTLYYFFNEKNIFKNLNINAFLYPLYSVMELLKSFYDDIFKYDVRFNEYSFEDINSLIDDENVKKIFTKWTNYLNNLASIKEAKSKYLDVKVSNFGYDTNSSIKMFDI
jgi:hypothetical protein